MAPATLSSPCHGDNREDRSASKTDLKSALGNGTPADGTAASEKSTPQAACSSQPLAVPPPAPSHTSPAGMAPARPSSSCHGDHYDDCSPSKKDPKNALGNGNPAVSSQEVLPVSFGQPVDGRSKLLKLISAMSILRKCKFINSINEANKLMKKWKMGSPQFPVDVPPNLPTETAMTLKNHFEAQGFGHLLQGARIKSIPEKEVASEDIECKDATIRVKELQRQATPSSSSGGSTEQ